MIAAERFYGLLLRLYPTAFRAEFGEEMSQLFRDLRRTAVKSGGSDTLFWSRILWDLVRSAPAQHVEARRRRASSHHQTEDRAMKALAIVSMLAGVVETLNASAEGWYGGIAARDGHSLTAGALGGLAGVLLVGAGAALLRRVRGAAVVVQGAAAACLAAMVLGAVLGGRLSIFATALGIIMPIVLLVFARRDRAEARIA